MHVSACILLLPPLTIRPIACKFVYVCICTYMMVFVCIWGICTYCARICMYFLESHLKTRETMPRPPCTVSRGGNRRATLRAPLGIWASTFFCTWNCCWDPIWRTPPRGTRPRPLKRPCRWPLGGLQCTIRALQSSPVACHSRSGWLEPIQTPEGAGRHPSKTPTNCNLPMSVYVSICMFMYVHTVYVCMPIYMCIYDLA